MPNTNQQNVRRSRQTSQSVPSSDVTPLQQSSGVGTRSFSKRASPTSAFASAIKEDRLSVVRDTGRVTLSDVQGVTPTTLKVLNTIGVWTPEEAYKLYSEGKHKELKSLTKYQNFTGRTDGIETLSNIIFVARNVDPTLTKSGIESALRSAPDSKKFETLRKKEIETYLKFLGLGKGEQRVTFDTRGAGVTINFFEQLQLNNLPSSATPKTVYGKTRQVMEQTEADKKFVIDRALKYPMTGIQKKDLNTPSVKEGKFNFDDLKTQYDNMIGNELIRDPDWSVIRPNDELIKEKVFGSSAILVGSTANPKIAEKGIISPTRPQGFKGLIIQSANTKNRSIRINGSMIVSNKKDMEELIDILGVSPKNGFAPSGYDYTNDTVAESPIMNVFIRPPEGQVNVINKPKTITSQVTESGNGYALTMSSTFDPYLRSTLWIADVDKMRSEGMGYTNALSDFKREAQKDLPKTLTNKKISDLPNNHFRKVITNGMEFGGVLCNWRKKGYDIVTRNDRALSKELDQLLKINDKYIKTPSTEAEAILTMIDVARDRLESKLKKKGNSVDGDPISRGKERKTMYNVSTPQCQTSIVRPWTSKGSVMFVDPNTPVSKKLDKVHNFCVNDVRSKRPDVCMAKLTKVTQNITDNYFGSKSLSPSAMAVLNATDVKPDYQLIDQVSEIGREMLTGQKTINDSNRPLRSEQKRNIMEQAKILNHKPLSLEPWDFVKNLKGKKLKTFAKRV